MFSFVAAAFGITVFASSVQAQNVSAQASCDLRHAPGVAEKQLTSGQRQRTYRLFVPAGYDGRTRLPLVLDLHPSGGTSAGQARTSGMEQIAERENFAVASPQAENGRWNVPVDSNRADDVAYISDVIDQVSAQLCVDSARVYATGFSGGGAHVVAAWVQAQRAYRSHRTGGGIALARSLQWTARPILTFHGLADPQNTYDGKANRGAEWVESVPEALAGWAGHNGCNDKVILEDPDGPLSTMRYTGCRGDVEVRLVRIDALGHTWPKQEIDATGAIWQFFKSQRLR
jgi:polyhydroxybutyrate depolymerase